MRFTIRDLVFATFVIGLAIGWAMDRTRCVQASNNEMNFWKNLAISLQGNLEAEGYVVDVGPQVGISVTHPDGMISYETGPTGRESAGFDPTEKWPRADILIGR